MSSPIHRLPPEILVKIFTSFRGPIHLLGISPQLGVLTTLSTVCSQWRETALSVSSLWTWLVFEYVSSFFRHRDERGDAGLWQRTDKVLARARGAPLTIQFGCWKQEDVEDPLIISRILAALCSHASQWAELYYVNSGAGFHQHPAFQLAKGHLNNLSRIHFNLGQVPPAPEFLTDCPALRSIELYDIDRGLDQLYSLQIPDIAWQQVQKLAFRPSSRSQLFLLYLLRKCSNLDTLSLRLNSGYHGFVQPVYSNTGDHIPISIRSLLIFAPVERYHQYTFFFEQISFPALGSIQIHVPSYCLSTRVDITLFVDLLTRSAPPVTFLSVERLNVSEQQWSSLLELMPNLETLEVAEGREPKDDQENIICTSQFFNKLLIDQPISDTRPRPPPLLPKLRRLVLHVHWRNFDFDELYEALISRCLPGSTGFGSDGFHSLQIVFYREVVLRDGTGVSEVKSTSLGCTVGVERLKSLWDVGVKVSVHSEGSSW
ncbi:hypothetical protein L218DRAFT_963646 [Marasmius fiardii PR-910]|nr:hypothetical protein L218DRAFT_963646 [Marasmius fiardii PR-910]